MRKYRSWLMGLGIGLIVGASMLQLILAAKEQAGSINTKEQLEEQASRAGYTVYPANVKMYTEEELQAKLDEAVKARQEAEATSPSPSPSTESKEPESTESASESPSATAEEEPKATTLYVRPGMTLTEVAKKLEELGVVEDGDDFLDKCWSIAKDLEVGTAVFTGQPTYRAIMSELTRNKP